MNYRHVYHAGNFADVLKHAVLCRIITYLKLKTAPFRVIDTHAGAGAYDLGGLRANKTGEWKDGIGRLSGAVLPPQITDLLAPYLAVVEPMLAGDPMLYPGSPVIAARLMRAQDRLIAIEKHPEDVQHLKGALAGDRRATALDLDGWVGWNAQVPPPERRGLVLVDPPFEEGNDFARFIDGLRTAQRKWSGGITLLWYPVKDPKTVANFCSDLEASGVRRILRLEMNVAEAVPEGKLFATGLIVVNPPFPLKAEVECLLPFLARRLAQGGGASWRCEWVVPE